ncbi:MAG TPA: DinB family protein [Thermomicrobiales bacterium]|nr:DinB family protein [Thermomicrobiales bacterium]
MNDGLIDAFNHNAWATDMVLNVCRELSDDQLDATATGTFGSVIETLRHIVSSEASYYRRLSGDTPEWYSDQLESADVGTLAGHAADFAGRWQRFRDVPAGVVLVQALHHAGEHRTQVCTTLTAIGVPPLELGVWEFAEDTDRARRRDGGAE